MENILNTISNKLLNQFKNNDKKVQILIFSSIILFIFSKLLNLFNFNLYGVEVCSFGLLTLAIGFKILEMYKANSKKTFLVLSSILIGLSSLIFGCLIIIYPFIIASTILI